MLLSDTQIHHRCKQAKHRVVTCTGAVLFAYTEAELDALRAKYLIYEITKVLGSENSPMIAPFEEELVREVNDQPILSYGLSAYSYDLRATDAIKRMRASDTVLDPKAPDEQAFAHEVGQNEYIIAPGEFFLAQSEATFTMPADVTGMVVTKSSYARNGLYCLTTALQAGWAGHVTLEFVNFGARPILYRPNEGVAQVFFMQGEQSRSTYGQDRKYYGQTGISLSKA